jgi:hypothetical protein
LEQASAMPPPMMLMAARAGPLVATTTPMASAKKRIVMPGLPNAAFDDKFRARRAAMSIFASPIEDI